MNQSSKLLIDSPTRPFSNWVFLVDDDEDDQFLLQQIFGQHCPEYALKSLYTGEELLQALTAATHLPSLILLDLNMPIMDGLEVLEQIRREPAYESIPVVILTTSDHVGDRQRSLALKANGFFTKPPTLKQFNEVVLRLKQEWLPGNHQASKVD